MKKRDVFDTISVVLGFCTTILTILALSNVRYLEPLLATVLLTVLMFWVCSEEHKKYSRTYLQRKIRERTF